MSGWTLPRRLHLLGAATFAALLTERWFTVGVFGAVLVFLAAVRPEALRPLLGRTFLVFALIGLAVGTWLGEPVLGFAIIGRAATVLTLARWVMLDASPFEFASLFGRRAAGFGFALGVALNALPALEDSARRTWDALRTRGGTRRHRIRNLRRFALATLANALRRADAVAEVALSRGIGPDRMETTSERVATTPGVVATLMIADAGALGLLALRLI